ncbi:MAG: tRNA dihydrouridine synthase DusB [Bacillota bacterium]
MQPTVSSWFLPQVFPAPMAGITDRTYRFLVREQGCQLAYSEMISDKALIYNNPQTRNMMDLSGENGPTVIQILGSDPEIMASAARIVEKEGANVIDINMGCPTPRIANNGEGSALLKDLSRAEAVARAVVEAVSLPVTVKMRSGWDGKNIVAVELAVRLEDAGVKAIAVHGRTRNQFYRGLADWGIIRQVKNAVKCPVIGNGDVWEPEDAVKMLYETGCDAIMIGRGALGNPWIFSRTIALLINEPVPPPPPAAERIATALRHLDMVIADKGERVGLRQMRKHLAWYIKGLRGAARVREQVNILETRGSVEKILKQYLDSLQQEPERSQG